MIKDRTNNNVIAQSGSPVGDESDMEHLRNVHDLESLFGLYASATSLDADAGAKRFLPVPPDDDESGASESDHTIKDDEREGTWTFVDSRLLKAEGFEPFDDSEPLPFRPSEISLLVGSSRSGRKWRVSVPGCVDIGLKRKGPDGRFEEYDEFLIVNQRGSHLVVPGGRPVSNGPSLSAIRALIRRGLTDKAESMLSDVTRAMFDHSEPIERFNTLIVSSLLREMIYHALEESADDGSDMDETIPMLLSMMTAG